MTTRFDKVLFFSDGARGEQHALMRTCRVAMRTGAEVTVIAVADEVSTNDPLLQHNIDRVQQTLIRERETALEVLIDDLGGVEGNIPPLKRLVVPGKDYLEVVKAARQGKYDLLVKAVNPGDGVKGAIFGSTDIRLIHYAPCPVLVLKTSRRKTLRNFLVAIDPHATAGDEISLNDTLLDAAASLAQQEGADLHLLHVQEQLVAGKGGDNEEIKALEASYKAEAEEKIRQLTEGYTNVHEHVKKGRPASVIVKFARDNDIDLLLMGNIARSGVPGILIGNTAERILDQVDCSVLVIKPDSWVSPLD